MRSGFSVPVNIGSQEMVTNHPDGGDDYGHRGQEADNIFDTPAFWNGSLYQHYAKDVARQFDWNSSTGFLTTSPVSQGSAVYENYGATPQFRRMAIRTALYGTPARRGQRRTTGHIARV
jgi:hypothetical protein